MRNSDVKIFHVIFSILVTISKSLGKKELSIFDSFVRFRLCFQTLVLKSKPTNVTSSCLFHATRTANVAMSKFDQKSPLPYEKLLSNLEIVKDRLGRPLTLSEKILYSHLDDAKNQDIVRGESYLRYF